MRVSGGNKTTSLGVTPTDGAQAPEQATHASRDELVRTSPVAASLEVVRPEAELVERLSTAETYADLGKHKLAARVLQQAEQLRDALIAKKDVGALHPGLWPQENADLVARFANTSAKLQELAKVVAPSANVPSERPTVLIFGLSANPPTGLGGHAGIVTWGAEKLLVHLPNDADPELAREDVRIDQVWTLPVYKHIYSSKRKLLDYDDRKAMAQLAFEDLPGLRGRVFVKDTERDVVRAAFARAEEKGEPAESVQVGTIDVVRKLMADHPDTNFVLGLGGDTYADLLAGKWKEGDTLRKLIPIVAIPRKGVAGVQADGEAPELTDISSTQVRNSTDLAFLKQALDPKVLDYIVANKLYAFGDESA